MYNITEFDTASDFQTCTITFDDKRVVECPTSELTPEGQEVDQDGNFLQPDGMQEGGLVLTNFAEYFDGVADDAETIKRILERAGIDSGQEWSVTGRSAGWQRAINTRTVKAENHTDLLYLIKDFAEVTAIVRSLSGPPEAIAA